MKFVQEINGRNPLGYRNIRKLLISFAIPSITAMLVTAIYNIVDQIFIGWGVGYLGNAATNVAFPLVTLSTALALLCGNGCAAKMSLELGAGNQQKARQVVGTGILLLSILGVGLLVLVQVFLEQLLPAFGSTADVLPYARDFVRAISFGLPFIVFTIGFSAVIRADGNPKYAMFCVVLGALLNIVLDPIFLFWLHLGVFGVGLATSISQFISFCLMAVYIPRMRNIHISLGCMQLKHRNCAAIFSLGMSHFINQFSMMIVQIALNNSLTHYGALSAYGSDIPLACSGLVAKVNTIVMAFVVGLAQASQPIVGFSYGAGQYERTRRTIRYTISAATAVSVVSFLIFQIFPRQIIGLFGNGSALFFSFSERYFRIYMFFTFLNGIQPACSNIFTSMGKAKKGAFLALTRQIVCLLPLILVLPIFMGLDGILYSGPAADAIAAGLSIWMISREMKHMRLLEEKRNLEEEPLFCSTEETERADDSDG
ncbi:MAG: MATE family efflux transporter [Oscillospiraceae bacterium]|nr:MATE family efflux transporter [Oscillospiraceae bacterium]